VAQVQAARDNQRAAEATALYNERVAERDRKLAPTAVSAEDLDNSISRARSSAAQADAAAAQTAAALSQVLLAERQKSTAATRLESARIERRMAETNLGYTELRAPITGHVTHRTVEMGDYIVPGRALFALVDPNVWVTANYKETQLSNMRIGQHADVRVDAFPGRILSAHVDSFQRGTGARFSLLPAENATGNYVKIVQRVPVKLVFDEPLPADMMLGPGMSVEPTVTVR
jgi:membrane fusion protein (multidrug efflux system)